MKENRLFTSIVLLTSIVLTACSSTDTAKVANNAQPPAASTPQAEVSPILPAAESSTSPADPAKAPPPTQPEGFTEADLGKLKWLEGTWRGSYKTMEFFERITFKGSKILIETFTDGTLSKKGPPASFELKNGELLHSVGSERWKAVSISEDAVQFVPASPPQPGEDGRASFKFERQSGNTWRAILETPETPTKPPLTKVYKMEQWSAPAK